MKTKTIAVKLDEQMNHSYDTDCFCTDCCSNEKRIADRAKKDTRREREHRERFGSVFPALQIIEVEK